MQTQFTDEQLRAIDKVKKLMALAAGNANEHEAALATERANFILATLNLEMDDLKSTDAQAGTRGKDRLVGGFYQHERDMWSAIAELNFCMYSTVKVRYDAETAKRERRQYAHHHSLIGRHVNILATKLMADYLLQTVERLTREYCDLERPYEKWHPRSQTAVSFRKGAAERLIEKINARRREIIREEHRKEAEQRAAASHPGAAPTGTALVVTNLITSEYQANYDIKYGEGAYARQLQAQADWEATWKRQQEEHERRMRDDPEYRKQVEREQREEARRESRRKGREYREPQFKGDASAFGAGYRRADSVGLDSQLERNKQGRIG